jgi:pimeloyl-ACP methyl ester carboxylesterase
MPESVDQYRRHLFGSIAISAVGVGAIDSALFSAANAKPPDRRNDNRIMTSNSETITYQHEEIEGVGVFYREAGPRGAPTIVLLHGYPSSSRQYAALIPLLAGRFHVIALDYPGFGESDTPSRSQYAYTFDHLAETTNALLERLGINSYTFYLQDFGGPIGFRIMEAHPERLQALIIQNANTYEEGLGANWAVIAQYWADRSAHREIADNFTSLELTKQRHLAGSPHPERYDPEAWLIEYAFLARPETREIMADLLYDYQTNVASYPRWQKWLRTHKPPTLVMWGRYDPSFITPGAEAYRRDVPGAEVHVLDAGHFALDEKLDEVAALMLEFLDRNSG